MAMIGKVEELLEQVRPSTRLAKGLAWLKDFRAGRKPEVDKILESLKPEDRSELVIHEGWLKVIMQCYQPRSRQDSKFEAHQHHTDLQYLCGGREWIEICPLQSQPKPILYDADENVFFPLGTRPSTRLLLQTGDVAVLFPNDAHAPCVRVEECGGDPVRKIVVKVKNSLEPA